ncbi:MAG: Lrp/AsnC family transcriptional regulator [Lachnospiraceae bacterium]|nr:Lrp/AsnC family transcriptional regulator [Lachnospiraceae bacterium]
MEELLRLIEKNPMLPLEDLAVMLDRTPEETAAMMDEAFARGYVRGYEALIDWETAGVNRVEAYIELHVTPQKSCGFDEIAGNIAAFPEVDSVLLMSGGYDLLVLIKGRSFQEIALFVAKRLSPLDNVLSTSTSFLLRTYKRGGRLYSGKETDERELTVL